MIMDTTTNQWTVWTRRSSIAPTQWEFITPAVPWTEEQARVEASRMQKNLRNGEFPYAECEAQPHPFATPEKRTLVLALQALSPKNSIYVSSCAADAIMAIAAAQARAKEPPTEYALLPKCIGCGQRW